MAEFCYICCLELFNGVHVEAIQNDFFGMVDEEDVKNGFLMPVLCEGCGWIMVDHIGKRVCTLEEAIENGFGNIEDK